MHEPIVSTVPRPGCNGKRVYATMTIARRMAKRVRQQHDGAKVEGYRCRACGHFHVGELS
jgi:rubrerythrin